MRTRLYLAGFVLLMIALACNFPAGLSTDPETELIEPTSVSTEAPTETESAPPPTETIEPPDPLAVLDTYVSLASVRQRLDGMTLTRTADSAVVTGRELLEWVLVDQQYDPRDDNPTNEAIFAGFDAYTFPHPGARIYLVNVATGLSAEAHGLYPWSLADYSVQEIDNLFVEDDSLQITDPALHRGDLPADMPNVQNPVSLRWLMSTSIPRRFISSTTSRPNSERWLPESAPEPSPSSFRGKWVRVRDRAPSLYAVLRAPMSPSRGSPPSMVMTAAIFSAFTAALISS